MFKNEGVNSFLHHHFCTSLALLSTIHRADSATQEIPIIDIRSARSFVGSALESSSSVVGNNLILSHTRHHSLIITPASRSVIIIIIKLKHIIFIKDKKQTISSSFIMKPILICLMTILVALTSQTILRAHSLWLFQHLQQDDIAQPRELASNQSLTERLANIAAQQFATQFEQSPQQQQQEKITSTTNQQATKHAGHSHSSGSSAAGGGGGAYNSYGSGLFSIAGIQPASLSNLLGTVGDTGFRYFNIQDQCRNRAACDLGAMLYKKLSFVHNWLVRTSVRSLADMNNVYMQSWMEGMTGRNCTAVYVACRQSPLDGLMNLAMLQNLMY